MRRQSYSRLFCRLNNDFHEITLFLKGDLAGIQLQAGVIEAAKALFVHAGRTLSRGGVAEVGNCPDVPVDELRV
jgi:hypothetical protein